MEETGAFCYFTLLLRISPLHPPPILTLHGLAWVPANHRPRHKQAPVQVVDLGSYLREAHGQGMKWGRQESPRRCEIKLATALDAWGLHSAGIACTAL